MSADTRTNEALLNAAHNGDEGALALLVDRHRERLERMVRLRMDRRLQGRVDAADVVQEAYLAVRGKFAHYCSAEPRILPCADKAEREAARALAIKGVELVKGGQGSEWALLALGVAEYRNGRDGAAAVALLAAAKAGSNNPFVTGILAYFGR